MNKNLYIYIAIWNFKYDPNIKNKYYISTYFSPVNSKMIDNYDALDKFIFRNLFIVDIYNGDDTNNKPYFLDGVVNSNVWIHHVHHTRFFTKEYLQSLNDFYSKKGDLSLVLRFENFSYSKIKNRLRSINVEISGYSYILKHLLSPSEYLLGRFLQAFYGIDMVNISYSFNEIGKDKEISRFSYKSISEDLDDNLNNNKHKRISEGDNKHSINNIVNKVNEEDKCFDGFENNGMDKKNIINKESKSNINIISKKNNGKKIGEVNEKQEYKNSIKNVSVNTTQKREFSSISSKNVNVNNNSDFSLFLTNVEEILSNNDLSSEEKQKYVEEN